MYTGQNKKTGHNQAITPELLQKIEKVINSIHHGSVNLTIQDGVLIQIEKSEKIRIPHK